MPRRKAAELDAEERDDMPTSDYAYVDHEGGKHLPISDEEHVRDAMARFNQEHFDDAVCKERARAKILAAAKRYNIAVGKDDDILRGAPDAKAASQPSVSAVHVPAPMGKVSVSYKNDDEDDDDDADDSDDDDSDDDAPTKGKRKKLDSTAGDDQGEGQEERATERPTRAFLTKLRELLTPKVAASDLDAAIRGARSHAGGKGKAAMRQMAGEDVIDLCADGGSYRLFLELRRAAEAPAWIPFLPKPGTYTHQTWGKIAVTRARSQQFIDNFNAKVYQEHIPLDAEHQTKLSGAFAYLRALRMNEDGSVDARVEWTDRGKALVEAERFRYFSPEWYDKWQEPKDGAWHNNVIIGGAFTTRPFFKDASLRSLVASERGLEAVETLHHSGGYSAVRYTAALSDPADAKGTNMADPQIDAAGESGEHGKRFAELEAKLAAEQAARQAQETALKQATEKIAAMEGTARRKRFTDEVTGRGEQSGVRWYGEPQKHVTFLERLSDTLGEDAPELQQYIEQQRAVAEAMRQSTLFSAAGSDAVADADSPEAQLDAHAKQYHEKHRELTYEQAYRQVFSEHPELQRQIAGR